MILNINSEIDNEVFEKIVNSNIDSNTTFFATEIYFQEIDVVLAYRLYVFGEIFDIGNQYEMR